MRRYREVLAYVGIGLLAFGGAAACGDDETDVGGVNIESGSWETVTDPQTGQSFRCLYVDGSYAANLLCYDPETGQLVGD